MSFSTSSFSSFIRAEKPYQPIVLQRGSDIVTVVSVADFSKTTATAVSHLAATQTNQTTTITVPEYTVDGAAANLMFHTEEGIFFLSGEGINPCVEFLKTKDGTNFPKQTGTAIGGYLANPNVSLIEAIQNAAKVKLYLKDDIAEGQEGCEAQQIVKAFFATLSNNEGWERKVTVHTDKWPDKSNESGFATQCYLTATKHIHAKHSDLMKLVEALQVLKKVAEAKFDAQIEATKANKELSAEKMAETVKGLTNTKNRLVSFAPLSAKQIIANSKDTYLISDEKDENGKTIKKAEVKKAEEAYEKYGNVVAVAFNDLAVATAANNGALKVKELKAGKVAEFSLSATPALALK